MSIAALNWAFSLDIKKTTQKFILVALADSADDYGICWPSYNTIAKKCSIDRSTAIRGVKALVDQGLLSKGFRPGKSGQNSNAFKLHMGIEITDDHPLKEVVADCHPLVAQRHPPSGTAPPEPTTEPERERDALTREEFLRGVDRGFQDGAFKQEFGHLSESEVKIQAEECWDRWGGNLKGSNPVYILRNWMRKGMNDLGTVRKPDKRQDPEKAAFQEAERQSNLDDHWRWMLRRWIEYGHWPGTRSGPEPNEKGHQVPGHIIKEFFPDGEITRENGAKFLNQPEKEAAHA